MQNLSTLQLIYHVHRVIAIYNRLGPEALETTGKGGRRHQYLTLQEEQAFLAPFFTQAECGEIATVAQIQHAFEERIGGELRNLSPAAK